MAAGALVAAFLDGAAQAAPPVALEPFLSGLGAGVSGIAALPGSPPRLLFALLDGRIVLYDGTEVRATPFLDLTSRVSTGGERGLLGLALHPRYAQNGLFFVYYTDVNGDTEIARYRVSADPARADPASRALLLHVDQPFNNHNGGALVFGPDGYLYIGKGDGGGAGDPRCAAQSGQTLLGKVLRLDVDRGAGSSPFYSIPPDNPFAGPGGILDEVWATGLRNPWRLTFDRRTGDLYIADVGQHDREEVSFEPAQNAGGRNYGWNVKEGSRCFSSACPGAPPCDAPGLVDPVLQYNHARNDCSVIGGYVYRGRAHPVLEGWYFYGDLCTGRVWRARRRGGVWHSEELAPKASTPTTFGEDGQGEVYVGTLHGDVLRLRGTAPLRADRIGVFEPAAARFLLTFDELGGFVDRLPRLGGTRPALQPLAGDWNGDGTTTVGVYDPAAGEFLLKNQNTQGGADIAFRLGPGNSKLIAIAGDWNGDGRDTVGFYNPKTRVFRLHNALQQGPANVVMRLHVGGSQLPVTGDWNGDGVDTPGLYESAKAAFRITNRLRSGPPEASFQFAAPPAAWRPLTGDWDGDGRDSFGLYDPASATFRLRDSLSPTPADLVFTFGPAGWVPVAGDWDGVR